ncbi:TPA: glycoside hydrolase family 97 [Candidatus Sumerlaeota bacterium]|nr:glycoside hydrolase family 97 [Candidatus Sumerlaeota bacterium]
MNLTPHGSDNLKRRRTAVMKSAFRKFAVGILSILGITGTFATAAPVIVTSPDGTIKTELTAEGGTLRYRILVDGKQVLAPSALGIQSDDVELGHNVTLGAVKTRDINEKYPSRGTRAEAVNHAKEATVSATAGGQSYEVDVHVGDDGVGVRLRLPAKQDRKVQADRSAWKLEGNPTLWATTLNPCYEDPYITTSLDKLKPNGAYGFPMTAQVGSVYLSLTEAALKDYGDLAVKRAVDGALEGFLHADPQGWTTNDAVTQPWRVTIIARDLTVLVNNTLVQNLNPPPTPELASAKWIVPGRAIWQWMAIGDPKFDDQHQWVDWTKEMGYEYYLVDDGWKKWKNPWESLASVCDYGKSKGVKVWVWVHSNEVKTPAARKAYFDKLVQIGAVGVKIDFPPATNRWWATWYYDTAQDAAERKLMVDFHGATKPTGMERTWPNALTREGIRGHEWQMTRYKRILDPQHDTILPFTRLLAGPGDYTPTVFESKELQGNTWSHELAQAILFTSPFLCTSGHPKDYVANPAKDVLSAVPAVWDETRVLVGSDPGEVVVRARRSGKQWFVAVINGGNASTLDIPCDFLGSGSWKASRLGDVADKGDAWDRQDGTATRTDHLRLELRPKGGFVGWFRQ